MKMTYKEKKIVVVIPAYNEEKHVSKVIDTMPDYVDKIIVVDDCSDDKTYEIVKSYQNELDNKLILIRHEKNKGVGGAIKTGYEKALDLDVDITAVLAGDAQMDPDQLQKLLNLIIEGKAEYTKGNRLVHPEKLQMPQFRRFGNSILTLLTKIATGYWSIIDPQNGYTAISQRTLKELQLNNIYDGYGYPNDLLIELNIRNTKVMDVEMPPVYSGQKSGIKIGQYSIKLSWLLFRGFFRRINSKYGGLHFHPLWLFYMGGLSLFLLGLFFGVFVLYFRISTGAISPNTVLLAVLLVLMGFQSLLFAMLFDLEVNKKMI
jgi:glycosyltransferase involved in cell wall biosynthesis